MASDVWVPRYEVVAMVGYLVSEARLEHEVEDLVEGRRSHEANGSVAVELVHETSRTNLADG